MTELGRVASACNLLTGVAATAGQFRSGARFGAAGGESERMGAGTSERRSVGASEAAKLPRYTVKVPPSGARRSGLAPSADAVIWRTMALWTGRWVTAATLSAGTPWLTR